MHNLNIVVAWSFFANALNIQMTKLKCIRGILRTGTKFGCSYMHWKDAPTIRIYYLQHILLNICLSGVTCIDFLNRGGRTLTTYSARFISNEQIMEVKKMLLPLNPNWLELAIGCNRDCYGSQVLGMTF